MQHAQPSTIRIYCRHALHSSIATNYCDIKLLICLASHNYIRKCVGAVVQNDAVNVRSHFSLTLRTIDISFQRCNS